MSVQPRPTSLPTPTGLEPRGPYTPAVRAGDFVFLSGQIGLSPITGKLADGGVQDQARQTLSNIAAVLDAAGLTVHDIARAVIYLSDITDWAAVNDIYAAFFDGATVPARTAIAVSGLPLSALVEIEITALAR